MVGTGEPGLYYVPGLQGVSGRSWTMYHSLEDSSQGLCRNIWVHQTRLQVVRHKGIIPIYEVCWGHCQASRRQSRAVVTGGKGMATKVTVPVSGPA